MADHILFVDDEFAPDSEENFGSYMSLYEMELSENGFDVTRATSADDALDLVGRQEFVLAILDVMMPPGVALKDEHTANGARTGLVLAYKVREINQRLPMIVLSNAAENTDLFTDLLDAGVISQVLFKLDVTPGDLVKNVKSFLKGN